MTITLEQLAELALDTARQDEARCDAGTLARRIEERGAARQAGGRLRAALARPGIGVIAEVKGASPVDGQIRADYDPVNVATAYEAAGAAAISVLTEPIHFGGSLEALESVVDAVSIPVLRKDFITTEYQISQAAAAGAAAVLLIAELLEPAQLRSLVEFAHALRLDALVEVHGAGLVGAAASSGSGVIGVNNRDLRTMQVDWEHALRVAPELPAGTLRVAESGVSDAAQLTRLAAAGYDAALIGSALMRAGDPGLALRRLLREVA
jgi:indole-3-glycerol phosphate synthase